CRRFNGGQRRTNPLVPIGQNSAYAAYSGRIVPGNGISAGTGESAETERPFLLSSRFSVDAAADRCLELFLLPLRPAVAADCAAGNSIGRLAAPDDGLRTQRETADNGVSRFQQTYFLCLEKTGAGGLCAADLFPTEKRSRIY